MSNNKRKIEYFLSNSNLLARIFLAFVVAVIPLSESLAKTLPLPQQMTFGTGNYFQFKSFQGLKGNFRGHVYGEVRDRDLRTLKIDLDLPYKEDNDIRSIKISYNKSANTVAPVVIWEDLGTAKKLTINGVYAEQKFKCRKAIGKADVVITFDEGGGAGRLWIKYYHSRWEGCKPHKGMIVGIVCDAVPLDGKRLSYKITKP